MVIKAQKGSMMKKLCMIVVIMEMTFCDYCLYFGQRWKSHMEWIVNVYILVCAGTSEGCQAVPGLGSPVYNYIGTL